MSIFQAYDIRGVYGVELREEEAFLIGYYFSRKFNVRKLKLAHDARNSYETLGKFFILGAVKAGCKVIYEGFLSTPNFYHSLFHGDKDGVIITASHNPKEYNGIKPMKDGRSLTTEEIEQLKKEVYSDRDNMFPEFFEVKRTYIETSLEDVNEELKGEGVLSEQDALSPYVEFLEELYNKIFTDREKEMIENINLGVDFSNGVSSKAITKFLEKTGVKGYFFNEELDGNFPSHMPDPIKAEDFIKSLKVNTDFYCCFDGDGDRIVFFDEYREYVFSDYIIGLFIEFFSSEMKKENFCFDLRVSRSVKDMIEERNLKGIESRVGRNFLSHLMKEEDCFFGGELSGHMFFKEFDYLDNPDVALIYMLKIYLRYGNYFSELTARYSSKYYKLKEIKMEVKDTSESIERLRKEYGNLVVSEKDGLSFDTGECWFNIRKSNTEPVLKINIEGINQEVVNKFKKTLEEIIKYGN